MKRITYILTFLIFSLSSCSDKTNFNSSDWMKGSTNFTSDIRLNMVDDLIESKLLINKTKKEVDSLLNNDRILLHHKNEANKVYYEVQEVYGWDIDPKEIKYLEVIFGEDSLVKKVLLKSTK